MPSSLPFSPQIQDRLRGVAVGAALGDAFGMPLEFLPPRSLDELVTELQHGRLPAGHFTDDTEMALALAESLLAHRPLNTADLTARFVAWYHANPADIGIQTSAILGRASRGEDALQAAAELLQQNPDAAGNGSLMRCWPVALAFWDDLPQLMQASALQSKVTHAHPDCVNACVATNLVLALLIQGEPIQVALTRALELAGRPLNVTDRVEEAPRKSRSELPNTGWVLHTLEAAVWGLTTTRCFEDAVIQVANLGRDSDTAATVAGALAGAAYGLSAIPLAWRKLLNGEWPLGSRTTWQDVGFISLADQLSE